MLTLHCPACQLCPGGRILGGCHSDHWRGDIPDCNHLFVFTLWRASNIMSPCNVWFDNNACSLTIRRSRQILILSRKYWICWEEDSLHLDWNSHEQPLKFTTLSKVFNSGVELIYSFYYLSLQETYHWMEMDRIQKMCSWDYSQWQEILFWRLSL